MTMAASNMVLVISFPPARGTESVKSGGLEIFGELVILEAPDA